MEFASERRYTSSETESCEADGDKFSVEDLLDFSKEDENLESFTFTDNSNGSSSPVVGAVDSCNSAFCNTTTEPHVSVDTSDIGCMVVSDTHFSDDLCIPCDDQKELEWLSKLVEEESFSNEDLQNLHLISGLTTSSSSGPTKTRPDPSCPLQRGFHSDHNSHPIFNVEVSVPAKARSKRARAAPCNWASRPLALSSASPLMSFNTTEPEKPLDPKPKKRRVRGEAVVEANGVVRRCMHCNTEKTPQWRTGPMGPKTLCNACGVRYKSGRLVPEYRPAASPTFVLAKHSNSHRKVMELRRKKETTMKQQMQNNPQQQNILSTEFITGGMILQVPNPNEYLIHQCVRPDFTQFI